MPQPARLMYTIVGNLDGSGTSGIAFGPQNVSIIGTMTNAVGDPNQPNMVHHVPQALIACMVYDAKDADRDDTPNKKLIWVDPTAISLTP